MRTLVKRLTYMGGSLFVAVGLYGCDFFTHRQFILDYDRNIQSADRIVNAIDEYFLSVGFQVLEKKHTVYPSDEKKTRFWVADGYKRFNFTRRNEYVTVALVNNTDIYLSWDQFGPNFQPSAEYFDTFRSALTDAIRSRLGVTTSVRVVNTSNQGLNQTP
jgi:hypothetical protein